MSAGESWAELIEVAELLEDYLTRCAVEEVADVNGSGEYRVPLNFGHVGPSEAFDVDRDVMEGPVVLVRRRDGARFDVEASVTVVPQRPGKRR